MCSVNPVQCNRDQLPFICRDLKKLADERTDFIRCVAKIQRKLYSHFRIDP